jgi:hypothetical protein
MYAERGEKALKGPERRRIKPKERKMAQRPRFDESQRDGVRP